MDRTLLCATTRVCLPFYYSGVNDLAQVLPLSIREETSLRAPDNFVFPTDKLVMTVAQWYQLYSSPEYCSAYIVLPKHAQAKNKAKSKPYAFSVELYINIGQVSCPLIALHVRISLTRCAVSRSYRRLRSYRFRKGWLKTQGFDCLKCFCFKTSSRLVGSLVLAQFWGIDWRIRGDF